MPRQNALELFFGIFFTNQTEPNSLRKEINAEQNRAPVLALPAEVVATGQSGTVPRAETFAVGSFFCRLHLISIKQ